MQTLCNCIAYILTCIFSIILFIVLIPVLLVAGILYTIYILIMVFKYVNSTSEDWESDLSTKQEHENGESD